MVVPTIIAIIAQYTTPIINSPVIVLSYIRTKTSFLGPFKKLFLNKEVKNCLDDLIYITTKSLIQNQN